MVNGNVDTVGVSPDTVDVIPDVYDPIRAAFGESVPDLNSMVEQLVGNDPILALLAKQFLQPRSETSDLRLEPDPDSGSSAVLVEAYELVETLRAEIERLQALLSDVGAAIGACGRCLGTERRCLECDGRGHPGRLAPDPEQFHWIVRPVLRGLQRARNSQGDIYTTNQLKEHVHVQSS